MLYSDVSSQIHVLHTQLIDARSKSTLFTFIVVINESIVIDHHLSISLHVLGTQKAQVMLAHTVSDDDASSRSLATQKVLDGSHEIIDVHKTRLFKIIEIKHMHNGRSRD